MGWFAVVSRMAEISLGLSFDDVLLVPQHSAVIPNETNISSWLTKGIKLNIPVVSAAMDSVSESELAIALAREGGIGVIHRNNTIQEQATMVAKVKRSENAVIYSPVTVTKEMTLSEVRDISLDEGFSGFPVVDADNNLHGIITGRDVGHAENKSRNVADVMTPLDRLVTASADTKIEDARRVLYDNRIEKLPLMDVNGKLAGLITGADIEKRMSFPHSAKDSNGQLRCGAAVGPGPDHMERATALVEAGVDALFIDAATGHTKVVIEVVKNLATLGVPVIAGNVVTEQGATDLCDAGVSAVKVGVGPGSICTTRVVAGVGMPQFTAIQNVAKVCRERGVTVIADGGIRYSGDVVKAMAAGADLVMLGSLLAGTEESPGQMVHFQGRRFKAYRGMGSLGAMRKGSKDRYSQNASGKMVAEGVEGRVPYKGSLADVVFQLMGGLRSGLGYVGATDLDALRERAVFTQITAGGLRESHAHDITITEEPTNYQPLS